MERQRISKKETKKRFLDQHHLIPRSRFGTNRPHNLLLIWRDKHTAWHKMFGNRTLIEVKELMLSVPHFNESKQHSENWKCVFGNKNNFQAYLLLRRIKKYKDALRSKA
jgi:hypothetical protein